VLHSVRQIQPEPPINWKRQRVYTSRLLAVSPCRLFAATRALIPIATARPREFTWKPRLANHFHPLIQYV
jgi:hypothetical protein